MLVDARVLRVIEVSVDGRVVYFHEDGAGLDATANPVVVIDPREFIEYFKWRVGPTMMDARTDRAIEVFAPNGNPVIYDMREKRFRRGAC